MQLNYSAFKIYTNTKFTASLASFAMYFNLLYLNRLLVVDLSMSKLPTAAVGWLRFCKANCSSLFGSFRSAIFLYSTRRRVYLTGSFELYMELVCLVIYVLCLLTDVFIAAVYKLCL